MLYRHAHALLELEGTDASETVGRTFRVVPADGDASDAEQSFVLWSTLAPRGEVPGESDPKAPEAPTAELVLEVSADGTHWVALEPHRAPQIAQVVRVPFLLPFVRAQVRTRGVRVGARAVLLGSAPFSLQPQVQRGGIVVVGRPS